MLLLFLFSFSNKHRIRSDHNSDESVEILSAWLQHVEPLYHSVDKVFNDTMQRHQNESSEFDWPQTRFKHLISLKEEALVYAQQIWADYIFVSTKTTIQKYK